MKDGSIQRESFILYKTFYKPISILTDEQLGRLFRAIYLWQIDGKAKPDPDIQMAFGFFINQFRIDNEKYQEQCEINRKNAQSRWHKNTNPIASNRIQSHTNDADNDNDKDNVNENDKKKKNSLSLPFSDQEFIDTWNQLRMQPKWKKKTVTALQKSLDKLSRYDVRFAVELMNTAIENDYQGVVYSDTPTRYEQWLKSHPLPHPNQGDEVNADVYSAYDYD